MSTPSTRPTPVLLSLASLLPTLPFPPPDELLSLATSLLSQSRQRAARLRPEEEVARTFACAHIACERLRNRLGLEIVGEGVMKPPAPPRVYRKLKGFLESALAGGGGGGVVGPGSRVQTPVKQLQQHQQQQRGTSSAGGTPTTPRTTRQTPTSTLGKRPRADSSSPSKQLPPLPNATASAKDDPSSSSDDPLAFAMPLIRHICKSCGLPAAAVPHVFVGATTIAREIGSRSTSALTTTSASATKRRGRGRLPHTAVTESPGAGTTIESPSKSDVGLAKTFIPLAKWPALLTATYLLVAARLLSDEEEDPLASPSLSDEDNDDEIRLLPASHKRRPAKPAPAKNPALTPAFQQNMRLRALAATQEFLRAPPLASGAAVGRGRKNASSLLLPAELRNLSEAVLQSMDATVGFYLLEAEDCGWVRMEWYGNIPRGGISLLAEEEDDAEDVEMEEHEGDDGPGEGKDEGIGIFDEDGGEGATGVRDDTRGGRTSTRYLQNSNGVGGRDSAKTPLRRREKHHHPPSRAARSGRKDAEGGGERDDQVEEVEDDSLVAAAGLLPGLATMFQPAVDWLSEERREDYMSWKEGILGRVEVAMGEA